MAVYVRHKVEIPIMIEASAPAINSGGPDALSPSRFRQVATGEATSPWSADARRWWKAQVSDRWAWLSYFLVTAAVFLLRWPTLSNHILSYDEPAYFMQAARLRSFYDFVYVYYFRVDSKTQVSLVPFILAEAINHSNAVWLVHFFGLLAVLVSCYLMLAYAHRFFGNRLAGLLASLLWVVWLSVGPGPGWVFTARTDFLTVLLEYFQTPIILAGLFVVSRAIVAESMSTRSVAWLLFAAGGLVSVAMLIKFSVALLAPLYMLSICFLWSRAPRLEGRTKRFALDIGSFVAGAAIPIVLMLVPYLFNSAALAELRFVFLDVNNSWNQAHGNSLLWRTLTLLNGMPLLPLAVLPVVSPWIGLRRRGRIREPASWALPLVTLAALSVFVSSLVGYAHLHYLVPVVALVALAAVGYAAVLIQGLARLGYRRLAFAASVLLPGAYFGVQIPSLSLYAATAHFDYYTNDNRARLDLDALLRLIQDQTQPDDTIWVYYHAPEIYQLSARRPATRDPDSAWMATFWTDSWFRRTASDLAKEKPPLIVGIDNPRFARPKARPLMNIPYVGELIEREYRCDPNSIRGVAICLRHSADA
ncbi:MAG: hypothetical protein HY332_05775 [Chloroflexi bacterium]|nr:hypothetical protein [Chloroflexota bacterium]